jgi:uncharacterized DUF497 family protein
VEIQLDIDYLTWDDWNTNHIAKHGLSVEDVEQVVFGRPVARETYKNRLQLIGPSRDGRIYTVIVGPVSGKVRVYYPFSARPASRQERRYFAEQKG